LAATAARATVTTAVFVVVFEVGVRTA